MPSYRKDSEGFICSIITGPSHVWLKVSFEENFSGEPMIVPLPPRGDCEHGSMPLDAKLAAVLEGITEANEEFGCHFQAARIWVVENDTPRHSLYHYAAYCLVKQLNVDPTVFG
ncbi:hypothetical protein C5Y96_08095 [Blastopirellula marina]|uniref:Uncharacterized protein n=1 Tax=Blastopirellula marina TaxID=124 RepID=A0A2S8FY51_9BACT|nr:MULTISPECIES: hypothetical protein [Pirellulaceae]PQO37109.1 hypothetical protein C5Y96_08095 [Blastopirellula marina]RCS53824.1 hypothetical protein DTL36_08105 [Bremerella cremea]